MTRELRIAFLLFFIVALGLSIAGCGRKAVTTVAEPIFSVRVMAAAEGSVAEATDYAVTVEPVAQSNVAAKMGGKVVAVPVVLGDFVRKGQVLVQLDQTDILNGVHQAEAALASAQANLNSVKAGTRPQQISMAQSQLNQAQANYDFAKKNYERMSSLYDQSLIPRQQLEIAETQFAQASAALSAAQQSLNMAQEGSTKEQIATVEAGVHLAEVGLETAKSQLQYTVVTAPVSGFITMVNINPGEMASPGVPVVGIADLSRVYATASVGQSVITAAKLGDKVSLLFQSIAGNQQYVGAIRELAHAADPMTKTYKIKILLDNPGQALKGGMAGTASFILRSSASKSIVLPSDAVLDQDGQSIVYVMENDRAQPKTVQLGVTNGKLVEILSGLTLGDKVIISGQHRLKPSSKVEVH